MNLPGSETLLKAIAAQAEVQAVAAVATGSVGEAAGAGRAVQALVGVTADLTQMQVPGMAPAQAQAQEGWKVEAGLDVNANAGAGAAPVVASLTALVSRRYAAFACSHPLLSLLALWVLYRAAATAWRWLARRRTADHVRRDLRACRAAVRCLLVQKNCSPLMLRLAWSDSATFDKTVQLWPQCGGATGAVRLQREYVCVCVCC